MKYETYEELIAAYKSGELTYPLKMDNDYCFVIDDDENELFVGRGGCDTIEIAIAAGIICERV